MQIHRFGDGHSAVAGAFVHGLVDGFAGGRQHQHVLARPVRGGAQRFERVGFAGAGRGLQRLHQKRRHRDVADGALLIGGQVAEVRGAHIEAGAGVVLVEHVEDALLLDHDRVEGELLMPLALVGLAGSR